MIVYGIPNCNTVKKAQDWLKENHVDFEFHDFKKKGVTAEKLTEWFDTFGWEKVINKNGLTFKKLSKEEQAEINSPSAAISYLMQNTSAIKRPIVEQDGKAILLGFLAENYHEKLK
ncbi:Spx/MgsR family RNA polymerase-binding regulatory protein [Pedobacter frigiditerrae]|uniref:Spx/MgsR family RNA polymerase-binding regulatory protein n=1 Tax=Pedobacter frigiditerrae TaxID=2530452 RepID=A0A4R0MPV1_9SPHI|nr:Spx/MgsR family RNA polymerase-binding regulatory protein [Pedobacter frigiditerrae]TCC88024.1 Spx/MgsR family RNA polymerase-binding regulatory protein [Pedobacter frigiditerrae]